MKRENRDPLRAPQYDQDAGTSPGKRILSPKARIRAGLFQAKTAKVISPAEMRVSASGRGVFYLKQFFC